MKKAFYTVMEDDKFINSNHMKDMNSSISEAIRFSTLDEVRKYFEILNKDRNFRIVKVTCTLEDTK